MLHKCASRNTVVWLYSLIGVHLSGQTFQPDHLKWFSTLRSVAIRLDAIERAIGTIRIYSVLAPYCGSSECFFYLAAFCARLIIGQKGINLYLVCVVPGSWRFLAVERVTYWSLVRFAPSTLKVDARQEHPQRRKGL